MRIEPFSTLGQRHSRATLPRGQGGLIAAVQLQWNAAHVDRYSGPKASSRHRDLMALTRGVRLHHVNDDYRSGATDAHRTWV